MQSSDTQICPGCRCTFSAHGGLDSHLRQTTRPQCKAIYERLQAALSNVEDDLFVSTNQADFSNRTQDEAEEEAEEPEVFGGDFFGTDYGPGDFPGWDQEDGGSERGESRSDEDEDEEQENEETYTDSGFSRG